MKRELGEMAPIRAVLAEIEETERAANRTHDDRAAAMLADVRRQLEEAIADALRPPEAPIGITVEEYAERAGMTTWAVYKRIRRGKLQIVGRSGGQILLPAA